MGSAEDVFLLAPAWPLVAGSNPVLVSVPSQAELTQMRFRLKTVEASSALGDKPHAGYVNKSHAEVKDRFAKAWDDLAGDKDKLVEKFGLNPAEWLEEMD